MRLGRLSLAVPFALTLLAACSRDADCEDEILIAASVEVSAPDGVVVDNVTIEKEQEEACGTVSSRSRGTVYQCWEQGGGGTYIIRVYSGERVWTASQEIESESCHVRERVELTFDLSVEPS